MIADSPRTNTFGQSYYAITGWPPKPVYQVGYVDLQAGLLTWRKHLRKSYRSLINWGQKNLKINIVNSDNLDDLGFINYQCFHAKIAGRITRPAGSWNLIWQEIKDDRGELILGYYNEKLATGSLFIDSEHTCVYWSGVYERSLRLPLAHYPLWLEIQRAADRGIEWLELGEIPEKGNPKECNIGFFKSGFATHKFLPELIPWTI